MPDHIVDAVEAALKGQALAPAGEAVSIARSLPHGHVAAVHAMPRTLGLPALLGPAGRHRDLALALIISRVVAPGSKLSTLAWWGDAPSAPTSASSTPPPTRPTRRWRSVMACRRPPGIAPPSSTSNMEDADSVAAEVG
jgi:hypothetical protein